MQTVVLVAGEHHAVPAAQLYASFGSQVAGTGWLLGASCEAVRPGAAVSARLPLAPHTSPVLLLGRIGDCTPGARITLVHDLPWRGRIHLHFRDEPGGSSLSVSAELDDLGLAWWLQQCGWRDDSEPDPDVYRIGLLTSKTGPGAVFALSCEHLAHLAVSKVNAEGGIAGRRLQVVVHDDATDAGRAGLEARRMVELGCRAIVASVTSASFEAVRAAAGSRGLPLIHPVLNEGGGGQAHVFRWGERPYAQVGAAAPLMHREGVDRRWFHVGNDYSWSHGAHRAALRAIDEAGGDIAAHRFVRLGTTDFSPVVDRIRASDARSVLSSLVGADEVAFQRQLHAAGLRETRAVLSLVMEDSTRERVGDTVADGIWSAFGYYNALDSASNQELKRDYAQHYGSWAPPISTFSEAVYESILLYADAARRAQHPAEVARGLRSAHVDLPRGRVELDGPHVMRQRIHVGQVSGTGYRLAPA